MRTYTHTRARANREEDERQQIRRVDRNRLKEVRQGDRKVDQKSVEAAEKPKPKH